MTAKFTAVIYFDKDEVMKQVGNDPDELYTWMLIKTQAKFGNFSGEIIDNKSKKVVKSFRKSPPD